MSLAAACAWTMLRSVLIAVAALPLCRRFALISSTAHGTARQAAWIALLIPLLSPGLLTGYAYANFSLSLVHYPTWNELAYSLLLFVKILPVGAVVIYFSPPPPVSDEAMHCRLQAVRSAKRLSGLMRTIDCWVRGPVRGALPALALMFLLAFQEFEMASLMGTTTWTVWLFDAQTGGLFLSQALRYALLPLMCELALLMPVLYLLWTGGHPSARSRLRRGRITTSDGIMLWGFLVAGGLMVLVVPLTLVLRGTLAGAAILWQNFTLTREIMIGGTSALISAAVAYSAAAWLLNDRSRSWDGEAPRDGKAPGEGKAPAEPAVRQEPHPPFPRIALGHLGFRTSANRHGRYAFLALALSLPGLLGSLMLSLSLLFVFQRPLLNVFYDTPLPWLVGLSLFLLPRAIFLQLLLRAMRPRHSNHLAVLLQESPDPKQQRQGRELLWRMNWYAHFWGLALLCYWAYVDLTTASLLAPTAMVSAPVRLYNLMHYGQNAVLSAMLCVAFAVPAALLFLLIIIRRPVFRLFIS